MMPAGFARHMCQYNILPQILSRRKNSLTNSLSNSTIISIIKRTINMIQITANELKTKGVSVLNEETSDGNGVIITVRGKSKFIVLPIEKYNYLRECELETALLEAKKDIKEGRYIKESVDKHIKRITRG